MPSPKKCPGEEGQAQGQRGGLGEQSKLYGRSWVRAAWGAVGGCQSRGRSFLLMPWCYKLHALLMCYTWTHECETMQEGRSDVGCPKPPAVWLFSGELLWEMLLGDGAQRVLEGEMLTQMHQGWCFRARAAHRAGLHLYGKWWGAEEIGILSCKVQRENSERQGESREWMEQEKTDVKGFVSCLSNHTGWNPHEQI